MQELMWDLVKYIYVRKYAYMNKWRMYMYKKVINGIRVMKIQHTKKVSE